MDSVSRQQLKQLVTNQHWGSIYIFKDFIIEKWNDKELKGNNEFETVCNVVERDSKIQGLNEFIESIEKLTLDET